MTDEAEAGASQPLAAGDVVRAIFPRMGGKERPGIIVDAVEQGGAVRAVVAVPATTRRTNQDGRLPLGGTPGFLRTSQLILPMACLLPISRVVSREGRVPEELFEQIEAGLVHWFGENWRRTQPPVTSALAKARVLHPLPKGARRRRGSRQDRTLGS